MSASVVGVLGVGLVHPEAAILRADDLGVTRGDGCFEGCRLLTGEDGVSTVDKLDAHLARMGRSAAGLGIELDEQAWRSLIATAGRAWRTPGEAALKLVLTRGVGAVATGFLTITALSADYARLRRDGLHAISLSRGTNADSFADAPWLLGGVKTLSYAVNMAAMRVAEQRGADDVIFVTADGAVLESPTSSVLWSLGRSLHTIPTGENGILAGTTQERLFGNAAAAGWDVSPRSATIAELHACEGLWLISSVRGPIEVVSLDRVAHVRHPQIHAEICQLSGF